MNFKNYLEEFLRKPNNSSESFFSKEYFRSNYYFIFSTIIYVYCISLSLYLNNFSLFITTYCLIAGWIIETSLRILLNRHLYNKKMKYFRFMSLYVSLNLFLIFPSSADKQILEYNLQIFYYSFFILNYLYFYYFDFNPILHLIISILNSFIIISFQLKNNNKIYFYV